MTEILEHVHYEIKSSGFEKQLIGGIVITGGGAQLKHMKQLVEYITGLSCRVGYPNEHVASAPSEDMLQPSLSTGVGLVIDGLERLERSETRSSNLNRVSRMEDEAQEETTATSNEVEAEEPEAKPIVRERRVSFLQKFKEFFETEED